MMPKVAMLTKFPSQSEYFELDIAESIEDSPKVIIFAKYKRTEYSHTCNCKHCQCEGDYVFVGVGHRVIKANEN